MMDLSAERLISSRTQLTASTAHPADALRFLLRDADRSARHAGTPYLAGSGGASRLICSSMAPCNKGFTRSLTRTHSNCQIQSSLYPCDSSLGPASLLTSCQAAKPGILLTPSRHKCAVLSGPVASARRTRCNSTSPGGASETSGEKAEGEAGAPEDKFDDAAAAASNGASPEHLSHEPADAGAEGAAILAAGTGGQSSAAEAKSDGDTVHVESWAESSDEQSSSLSDDWRAFRARLVLSERAEVRARPGDGGLGISEKMEEDAGTARVALDSLWAHALYAPEKGCILVASELLHGYNFFQRSVILLLGAGTGPSDGPYGIALNKPFPRTVSEVDSILPGLATTFGPCQVHVGGPIGPRTVLLVHGHSGLDGHCEVLPGVFVAGLAGLPAAVKAVESGQAKAEDFQVVLGYAGWGEKQLRQEIAQGWWYPAACSREVILEAQKRCQGKGKGKHFWTEVLDLMGGEYADVGNRSSNEHP